MANYIKSTAIQDNSISESKLDSSLQSWKETITNHINNTSNPHNITKSSIGLDNVTNDAQVKRSELGVANGVATLDSTGKVPSGQLPSYVDDVIEGYLYNGVFYKDTSYTTSIVGESGKIYIDLPTNKTYRWTGSVYGVISETIALGETPSTAYRGDRGKIAYDHSQSAHAPSNAQANVIETIKVNGTALTPNSKAVDITIPTVGNGTITIKQGGTSKGTFTTNQSGNTTIELTDNNTTYTASNGISLSGTTFSNSGVRSITTGTTNGTISVNTNGNISNIGVYGLKSAAYTNSSDYAAASHTHSYLPLTGGTLSGSEAALLKLDSSNSSYNATLFKIGGVTKSEFGFAVDKCSYMYDYTSSKYLGIDISGTPFYGALSGTGKYTLIHSGNIGSQVVKGLSMNFVNNLDNAAIGELFSSDFKAANRPSTNYATGITICNNQLKYNYQLAFSANAEVFVRYKDSSAWKSWKQLAFTDSNVASASKWETPRTITLTGSVTGSVSIDGSQNVSLATTTNHTHTFASLTDKPTTISGYGITDALTSKFITYKEDFQHYVILLCRIGTNTTNDQHTINGTFWTTRSGSSRYQAAYINIHCADWLTNHNEYYGFTPFGLDKKCRLVTCTYQSVQYLAITFENTQAISIFFDGSYSNILFTPILYYTSNTSTVNNSEIYNSITEVTYNKIPLISSAETALTSSNYNTYAPKLDGTGATGTWGISISGDATTASYASVLMSISKPTTDTVKYNKPFSYFVGQLKIGTAEGNAYAGSSSNYNLLSFPPEGTTYNEYANVMTLRLSWDKSKYWHDIFASPNTKFLWHRMIHNGTADDWCRIVEEATDRTWGINISGNAATATNADKLDGYHKNDILRSTIAPTSVISLNDVATEGIDFTSWDYAHSVNVNNQPGGDGVSSAASVVSFGTDYPFQIYSDFSNTSYLYYRSYYAGTGGWKAWRQFAFLDSNVASATKLANSRTIWGQSFDGSGNVSGALSGVTTISASGTITSSTEAFIRSTSGSYGTIFESYNGKMYVLLTDKDDQTGANNSLRPLMIEQSNGNVYLATTTEKVGIGTTTPSYKLHVAGSILSDLGNNGGVLIGRYGNTIDGYANGALTDLHINYASSGNLTMCIGGGNVGIGTTSPTYKLDVAGSVRVESLELNYSTPYIDFHYGNSTDDYTSRIIEDASGQLTVIGKLRIGSDNTTSNNYTFYVASGDSFFYDNVITSSDFSSRGDAIIDGIVSCTKLVQTSDIKYKTNIKQIEYEEALKIIENLNPVTWDWNENTIVTGSSSGFVAQEAEEFIPNAISRDNENNLSLDYTQLHSYEIRVIQEQQKEIKDLKQRLEVLENLVLQLTNREI